MTPTYPAPARPARRPAPGWPWWIVFGVVLPPTLVIIVLVSFIASGAHASLTNQQRLLGNSAVVAGTFLRSDALDGVPTIEATYSGTLPDTAPGHLAGSVQELDGVRDTGFPPSDDFPPTQDFLVSYNDDRVDVEDFGDPGSIEPVTDSSVAENQRAVDGYSAQLVGLYIWLGLVITVVPTIAITLSVRRRRAAR
jgi:hypothetical protein